MTVTYSSSAGVDVIFNQYGIESALDDNRDGAEDSGLMASILANADAEVESYVVKIYPSLALSGSATIPQIVKTIADKIAASDALARQGTRNSLREEAMAWLNGLGQDDGPTIIGIEEANLPGSTTHEVVRAFGEKQLDKMGEPGASFMSTGEENSPKDA